MKLEELYANRLENLGEVDHFVGKKMLYKLTEHLNRPKTKISLRKFPMTDL